MQTVESRVFNLAGISQILKQDHVVCVQTESPLESALVKDILGAAVMDIFYDDSLLERGQPLHSPSHSSCHLKPEGMQDSSFATSGKPCQNSISFIVT